MILDLTRARQVRAGTKTGRGAGKTTAMMLDVLDAVKQGAPQICIVSGSINVSRWNTNYFCAVAKAAGFAEVKKTYTTQVKIDHSTISFLPPDHPHVTTYSPGDIFVDNSCFRVSTL